MGMPEYRKKPVLTYGAGGKDEKFLEEGFELARRCPRRKQCVNHWIKCWICDGYSLYEPTAKKLDEKLFPRQIA